MPLQINEVERSAIEAFYQLIKESFKVKKFILFGSRARGEADVYSDIDLLVLTEKPKDMKERYMISEYSADINVEYGVAISCLYMNEKDWESEDQVNPLLKQNIEREGVVLEL
jgi:predicted nucleotidyltransferase